MKITKRVLSGLLALVMVLSLCPVITFAAETGDDGSHIQEGAFTESANGKYSGVPGQDVVYLSDDKDGDGAPELFKGYYSGTNGKAPFWNQNYNGSIYARVVSGFDDSTKAATYGIVGIYSSHKDVAYDSTCNKYYRDVGSPVVRYYVTDIAVGAVGTKFGHGIGVLPVADNTAEEQQYVMFDVSDYDYFYSVVGITGSAVNNNSTNIPGKATVTVKDDEGNESSEVSWDPVKFQGSNEVVFIVYGSVDGENWDKLATTTLANYRSGEFNVDVSNYNYLKLSTEAGSNAALDNLAESGYEGGSTNSGCNSVWANACVYNVPVEAEEVAVNTTGYYAGMSASKVHYLSDLYSAAVDKYEPRGNFTLDTPAQTSSSYFTSLVFDGYSDPTLPTYPGSPVTNKAYFYNGAKGLNSTRTETINSVAIQGLRKFTVYQQSPIAHEYIDLTDDDTVNPAKTVTNGNGTKVTSTKAVYRYHNQIVLGPRAVPFNKGLSFRAVPAENTYVVFDVRDLDVDHFYSVVGINGTENYQNNKTKIHLAFEVYGSKDAEYNESSFEKLAYVTRLTAAQTAEFDVNIEGYNYIKLVCVSNSTNTENTLHAAWGNAAFYKEMKKVASDALEGKSANITNRTDLADWLNGTTGEEHELKSYTAAVTGKLIDIVGTLKTNQNYHGYLYKFENGERSEKLASNKTIALGYNGTLYDTGLGFHPDDDITISLSDRYLVFDVRELNANRFYSVVGATAEATNGETESRLTFELLGSKSTSDYNKYTTEFELLASATNIYHYYTAEFDVDITGYNYLKLVVKMSGYGLPHSSCGVAWADACVYTCAHADDDKDHYCDACGDKYTDHDYVTEVIKPCYKAGYTNYTCSICGDRYKSDYVEADDSHEGDENTNDSESDHICDNCGKAIGKHADADDDNKCDYCGGTLSNNSSISDGSTLTGELPSGIKSKWYLSDLFNSNLMVECLPSLENSSTSKFVVDVDKNYNDALFVFGGAESARKQIAGHEDTDEDGNRTFTNTSDESVTYNQSEIALGINGTKFAKGLGVHPSEVGSETGRYIVYDVRGLNADYFYAVAGATDGNITNPKDYTRYVTFEVLGKKPGSENWDTLDYAEGIRSCLVAEFNISIEGYDYIKLVAKMSAGSVDHNSCAVAWGNACVYSTETEIIPSFTDDGQESIDAGNGNYQYTYTDVTREQVNAYIETLTQAGWTEYDNSTITNPTTEHDSYFVTYTKGLMMVHLNYFADLDNGRFQIIYGRGDWLLPNEEEDYEAVVTPSVSIIERTDGVLCMVVQLADGSFIVIDGGYPDSMTEDYTAPKYPDNSGDTFTYKRNHLQDMETLLEFLEENNPNKDQLPQVTWMITHSDSDHTGLPYIIMWGKDEIPGQTAKTNERFDLNAVVYNFPNYYNVGLLDAYPPDSGTFYAYHRFVAMAKEYFPDAEHYIYHTGQTWDLPGVEIEFLYTPEDARPYGMPTYNHTSGIWRFNFDGGKSLMITGDAQQMLKEELNLPEDYELYDNQIVDAFGGYLKSDMLQIIHHGSNGGSLKFYQAVDPYVCFWPQLDINFLHDQRHLGIYNATYTNGVVTGGSWYFNYWLRHEKTNYNGQEVDRIHYTTSETHTVYIPTVTYHYGEQTKVSAELYCKDPDAQNNTALNILPNKDIFDWADCYVLEGWATSADGTVVDPATITVDGTTKEVDLYAVGEDVHVDNNKDHKCDRNCGKTDMGIHGDSAEDDDHVCDYGC
ncbi:MAG: NPCBM/NEW2 domain-containing protein, partial [Oscillospiraceae bacterium]|nr:NPCBM/NEW2 domain-containing protein [Oscillospiraceae bacterium]